MILGFSQIFLDPFFMSLIMAIKLKACLDVANHKDFNPRFGLILRICLFGLVLFTKL